MTRALEIIQVEGEHRLDSRLLAKQLGYEHKQILQSIRRHKERLEAKSLLLQNEAAVKTPQARGVKYQTYYLLTERQCLILAGSLKKGDEALEWQDTLIDAFVQARNRVRELEAQQTQPCMHTITDAMRARAMKNLNHVPEGYFSVIGELFKHLYNLEALINPAIDKEAMLEISVGQGWSTYAREVIGIPDHVRRTYDHCCPNGRMVQAWAYPIQYVNTFATWLWTVYFPQHFLAYQRYRTGRVALLAPRSGQKRIR